MSEIIVVIVLAAGKGSRMKSSENKQFTEISGKPMLYYSLRTCDETPFISYVIVVAAAGEEERICKDIIEKYGIKKVRAIVPGGKEREDSVYEGIKAIDGSCDYVFVHDGARPCVTTKIFTDIYDTVRDHDTAVAAVRENNTIRKVPNGSETAKGIIDRSEVWIMQTPQAFSYAAAVEAFDKYHALGLSGATDDAQVVEEMLAKPIHIVESSYRNIKVTTREDIAVAEVYLSE